jgi:uncharacterized membrane protein
MMATQFWQIGIVILSTFVTAFSPILLKLGAHKVKSLKEAIFNKNIVIGISLYAISYVIVIPALKYGDLSVLYPFVSLSYVWVALLSVKFLKERMSMGKWVGIFLIVLGVSLIGLSV